MSRKMQTIIDRNEVNLLNELIKKSFSLEIDPSECCVCLEPCTTMLSCTHIIHRDCLMKWLRDKDTCPHCRRKMSVGNYKVVDWEAISMLHRLPYEQLTFTLWNIKKLLPCKKL